jgi:hypothetical protein
MTVLDEILECCTDHLGMILGAVESNNRKRALVYARYFYFKYAKEKTRATLQQIGLTLKAPKDHATVMHGIKTINFQIETYKEYRKIHEELEPKINDIILRGTESKLVTMENQLIQITRLLNEIKENHSILQKEVFETIENCSIKFKKTA